MARKRIVISSSGGIAAGAPFVLDAGLFVQQASPPVVNTGRFARLNDAMQSLIAPSVTGGADSFVMGEGASSPAGQANVTLVGADIVTTAVVGQANRTAAFGGRITWPAAQGAAEDTVAVGWDIAFVAGGLACGQSVVIGTNVVITPIANSSVSNTIIGANAAMTGAGGTVLGANTSCNQESSVVGEGALASGDQAEAFGHDANAGLRGIALGNRARTDNTLGGNSIAIGWFTDALDTEAIAIGNRATANFARTVAIGTDAVAGAADSICLGNEASTAVANQCTIGSETSFITLLLVGAGGISATPRTLQFRPPAGSGNNAAGWSLDIVAAWNTGNNATGQISFQTGVVGAGGVALQAIAERLAVIPSTGAAAAPILRFANFTSGVAAAALPAIVNAPLARQPIDYIPVVTPAGQGWIPVF